MNPPCEDTARRRHREPGSSALTLDLPASRTVRNKFSVIYKPPTCIIFVTAAEQTKTEGNCHVLIKLRVLRRQHWSTGSSVSEKLKGIYTLKRLWCLATQH